MLHMNTKLSTKLISFLSLWRYLNICLRERTFYYDEERDNTPWLSQDCEEKHSPSCNIRSTRTYEQLNSRKVVVIWKYINGIVVIEFWTSIMCHKAYWHGRNLVKEHECINSTPYTSFTLRRVEPETISSNISKPLLSEM